jgi:pimeloyl-ACP methyl ester carboxylesterase
MPFVTAAGRRLEYQRIDADESKPVLVFLHEGLGSITQWRDFPHKVVAATGCSVLLYARYGYGQSDVLAEPRKLDFMHDEALVALPDLLSALEISNPILVGHSDGASIALIHAVAFARRVAHAVVLAPHVFVEEVGLVSIRAAREAYRGTDLRARLARYHDDADSAFGGWNEAWLDPAFAAWNIEPLLPRIRCPLLAIQGVDDEYGTMAQIDAIAARVPATRVLKLQHCGHSPHRDQPEAVIAATIDFMTHRRPA